MPREHDYKYADSVSENENDSQNEILRRYQHSLLLHRLLDARRHGFCRTPNRMSGLQEHLPQGHVCHSLSHVLTVLNKFIIAKHFSEFLYIKQKLLNIQALFNGV
uniref:Uncharacterized protein n=1 Tax=Caenorhabditis tropicalis TaxID=1561998 RepID=A0A1I7USD0_9PELO